MNLEHISSKTLNFSYITSKKVMFHLGDFEESKKAVVFYCDSKVIGLATAHNSKYVANMPCLVELLYFEKLLTLNCVVKSFDDGILYLTMPRKATVVQQRGDLRVGCDIKCHIEEFSSGKIKNLSAGGAYIALDSPLDENILTSSSFKVCFSINKIDLRLSCSAIETNEKYVRVKFENLTEDTKEYITLHCCSVDAAHFRGAKLER